MLFSMLFGVLRLLKLPELLELRKGTDPSHGAGRGI